MAQLIFDSGALIAFARGNQQIAAYIRQASLGLELPLLPTAVIAETWRGGSRSALIARAIKGCLPIELSEELARRAGELLGRHESLRQQRQKSLVVDAIVVMTAVQRGGGRIVTSDPSDIGTLAGDYPQVEVERV
jgi:predicted nucleic acid-binding protein